MLEMLFLMMIHRISMFIGIHDILEISLIIVTDDYLCYKEPKSPYKFLILLFNELFKFKTSDKRQH